MAYLRLAIMAAAVIFGGSVGCDLTVAFKETVLRSIDPVQLGCATALDGPHATVPAKIVFRTFSDRRAHPQLARVAGQIEAKVDHPVAVPFDPKTLPLDVLEADLGRVLTAIGVEITADPQLSEDGIRLDGNLIAAHSIRTPSWWTRSEVTGYFVFTLGLVRQEDEKILWTAKFAGKHILESVANSSRSISEAVNGAYCDALGKFVEFTESDSFRNALLDH